MKIYVAISFVTILILGIFPPSVSAMVTGNSPSGRTVTVHQPFKINQDPRFNFTSSMNEANKTDMSLSNYNLTVKPFLTNNSDKAGIVITPFLAPLIFNRTVPGMSISIGSYFMLAPQDIMDGTSEIYYRCPIVDIAPLTHTVRIRVYAVNDPINFNMSYSAFGTPIFNSDETQGLIYDMTDDPTDGNVRFEGASYWEIPETYIDSGYTHPNWIMQQVQYPNTTAMNFTWFKICIGLFPSEWYFFSIDYTDPHAGEIKLAVSPCDFGQDGKENSWLYTNGHNYYEYFDFDTTMIVTYGISNGITGIGVRENKGIAILDSRSIFHMNASIPFGRVIDKDYLNIIVPYMLNTSVHPHLELLIVNITLYASYDDSNPFARQVYIEAQLTGTYNFFIKSVWVNFFKLSGTYLDHIRVDFNVQGGTGAYARATMIKLWGTRDANTSTTSSDVRPGFTDIYWTAHTLNYKFYLLQEKQGFVPYGYYGLSNSNYASTEINAIVITGNTPKTPLGIFIAIQKYRFTAIAVNISDGVRQFIHESTGFVLKMLDDIEKYLDPAILLFSPWLWTAYHWVKGDLMQTPLMSGLFNFLRGIGIFLWQVIDFVIDAIQWFSYWCVRFVYSFSLIMVYLVNVYGVISICSGLMAYSRTGKGKDFYRAFKNGWNVCYGIIAFLLAMMILAISTLGAVIPL